MRQYLERPRESVEEIRAVNERLGTAPRPSARAPRTRG
jgi:hypothetical protein